MALTAAQEALRLFKKSMGVADTDPYGDFFNEKVRGSSVVLPNQIWAEGDKIPSTAPVLPDLGVSGVCMHYVDLVLSPVAGTAYAFSNPALINAIPFNWDANGSYNYTLKDSSGGPIPFGQNNWVLDIDAGVLTFYGYNGVPSTPPNMPPKISFYKYIGALGLSGITGNQELLLSGTTLYLTGGTIVSSVDLSTLPTMVQELARTHRNMPALTTFSGNTGNGYLACLLPITGNLVSGSSVNVLVNGVQVCTGDFSDSNGFFSPISGTSTGDMALSSSARALGAEVPGDYFYWRDNTEYLLDTLDRLDFIFLVNK